MTFATTATVQVRAAANADAFDAPAVKVARIAVGEFRALVRSLDWKRHWLTGGTRDEFLLQNVPASLLPAIAEIEAALPRLGARFADDRGSALASIEYARNTLDRWQQGQARKA